MPSNLHVVDIKPPECKDPVWFLRNLADEIESGQHGDIDTLAISMLREVSSDENPLLIFVGGRNCMIIHAAYAFGAAHQQLLKPNANERV